MTSKWSERKRFVDVLNVLEDWVICNSKPKTVLLLLEYILYSISDYITVYYADIVLFMEKTYTIFGYFGKTEK